jgi:hypothetical protein
LNRWNSTTINIYIKSWNRNWRRQQKILWPFMFMDWQNYIVKMAIPPKAIYIFNEILIKIPMSFFTEMEKIIPKIYMETWKSLNSKSYLNKKHNAEDIKILEFKLYYRAKLIKQHNIRNRHKCQRYRIEDPQINPYSYSHLISNKETKNIHRRKDSLLISGVRKTACRGLKLDPYLLHCTKINLKWIKF